MIGVRIAISVSFLSTETGTFAYWTNNGNNSIKGASLGGGPLVSIDVTESPRDILTTPDALFFTAAGANSQGSVYAYLASPPGGGDPLVQLQTGLDQRGVQSRVERHQAGQLGARLLAQRAGLGLDVGQPLRVVAGHPGVEPGRDPGRFPRPSPGW